jgi:nitrogen regulatory protein PII
MKMIWALLRSESVQPVIDSLKKTGIYGLTRMNPTKEIMNPANQEETVPDTAMLTETIMIVLPDNDVAKAIIAIRTAVKASIKTDRPGKNDDECTVNGRIFVTYVEDYYTMRDVRSQAGGHKT